MIRHGLQPELHLVEGRRKVGYFEGMTRNLAQIHGDGCNSSQVAKAKEKRFTSILQIKAKEEGLNIGHGVLTGKETTNKSEIYYRICIVKNGKEGSLS